MINSLRAQTVSQTICLHCGTFFDGKSNESFCCSGCAFVFEHIQAKGLERYYTLRNANPPTCAIPAQTSNSNFDYFNDPEFTKKISPDGETIRFYLEGLNCTACLWLLEKLPDYCADAAFARVNMATSTISVRRSPAGSFSAIARTLDSFGYRPHALRTDESSAHLQRRERRRDFVRLGIAGAATGNIMILAVSLYAGAKGDLAVQFRELSALLALPVLTYCAWPFYRNVATSLKTRRLNIDVPIVAAIIAGVVSSAWSLRQHTDFVYFDSLSTLVFLLLASRMVLKGVQSQQMQSTNLEDELLLSSVERQLPDGCTETMSSLHLVAGDVILLKGEVVVPVDGIIEEGRGLVDTAVLTGESESHEVGVGHRIEAGSRNQVGEFKLRVVNPPRQTRLAQILRDTEAASREKSSFVHLSDRIAHWFIGIVFLVAFILIAAFWSSDIHEGVSRALALIIVTCPCVFGIAIPLSMSLAIRSAARKGIVIKDADVIERLWKSKILIFDKTGTLTTGEMSVLDIAFVDTAYLKVAMALEENILHPVARAISQKLKQMNIDSTTLENISPLDNGGVGGWQDGIRYELRPLQFSPLPLDSGSSFIRSKFGLFRDEMMVCTFELGDRARSEAKALLEWARARGLKTWLLSGDRKGVVERCAQELGFSQPFVHFEMTPERKAQFVRDLGETSVMIGDGANDAAALASAGVGIAVCGGLDISLRAADIYLTRPNLLALHDLFATAGLTRKAIYRNLLFSASFNAFSGFLAVSGFMTPLGAAVLMPLSSLTILLSAIWTGRKLDRREKTR